MIQIASVTIPNPSHRQTISRVLNASLQAVEPGAAVARHVQLRGDELHIGNQVYNLSQTGRVLVVGAGKAGAPMTLALSDILGKHLAGGIVIVKEGHTDPDNRFPVNVQLLEASHPLPDQRGVQGAGQIANLLENTEPDDLVICLISGGGSALLVSPVAGITLQDLQSLTSTLLACGANINEINTLRKHLEKLKGGGLARTASPAKTACLILSDVVGDPLDVIASGPTAPDSSTFEQAYQVLRRYQIEAQVPPAILVYLDRGLRGELPETPKPGEPLFDRVQNLVIGSNLLAAQAAIRQAEAEGYHAMILTTRLQGEARQAGCFLAAIAQQIAATGQPLPRPACLVSGGETTVTLTGYGKGGRNQEAALGALSDLAGLPDIALVTLATDGQDGPTDAAGAIVTGQSLSRAIQSGLDPVSYLANHDSYHFFAALGDLLRPGPTLTNVNDLTFVFAF